MPLTSLAPLVLQNPWGLVALGRRESHDSVGPGSSERGMVARELV